jgi:hypothetical protein
MLTLHDHLHPNKEEVAAKVIDGEAILINLSNGIYYSLDNVGGLIWELIEGGSSLEAIVGAVRARYDISRAQAQADVERLAAELLQENLVTVSSDGATPLEHRDQEQQSKLSYAAPILNIYRDMGDLLALDPPMPGLADMAWKESEDEVSH